MDEVVSIMEFARRVNVSRQAVTNAVKTGRISKLKEGGINFTTEIINWYTGIDPSKVRDGRYDNDGDDEDNRSLASIKKEKEVELLRKVKRDNDEEEGKLVRRDYVEDALFTFCVTVRDGVLAIPERVSSEVGADIAKYISNLLLSTLSDSDASNVIAKIDHTEIERIVNSVWSKESMAVLDNIKNYSKKPDVSPKGKR